MVCSLWPGAASVELLQAVDVHALRQRLGLTREGFAIRHGPEIEMVRNREVGRRDPDTTAQSDLRAVSNAPERVEQAYAPTPNL